MFHGGAANVRPVMPRSRNGQAVCRGGDRGRRSALLRVGEQRPNRRVQAGNLQEVGGKLRLIAAACTCHRLGDFRTALEPGLRDGLQVGQRTAFSQHRFDRRASAHRFGKLGNQFGQRVAEIQARGLPVGAAEDLAFTSE